MGREDLNYLMVVFMRVILNMVIFKEVEKWFILMEKVIKVSFSKINVMVKELAIIRMEKNSKVNLKMINRLKVSII